MNGLDLRLDILSWKIVIPKWVTKNIPDHYEIRKFSTNNSLKIARRKQKLNIFL